MKEYMEDPDDVEATNAASACLQETPELPMSVRVRFSVCDF